MVHSLNQPSKYCWHEVNIKASQESPEKLLEPCAGFFLAVCVHISKTIKLYALLYVYVQLYAIIL